tara:strand:+ start:432 stop:1010 length:579 start_codon:yes stop_codon:yes gene_type:complete
VKEYNFMSSNFNEKQFGEKMDKTISSFKKDLGTLRTGRANPAMFDLIRIEVYGQKLPINQLATITVPEPRTISIQVWDKSNVNLVDSEIKKSNLGVNPQIDGQILRIRIPQLTEERRIEITKSLKTIGEKNKVSIRNIRREANDSIKKLLKEKKISEDESVNYEKSIQKNTDKNIELIDKILADKEKEILQI